MRRHPLRSGILVGVVSFFGVGFLHAFIIKPYADANTLNIVGRNLFVTDCGAGLVLVIIGICMIIAFGFNAKGSLTLSIGLSIVGFWVFQALAMLG